MPTNVCFYMSLKQLFNVMVLRERIHVCRKDDACLLMIRLNR